MASKMTRMFSMRMNQKQNVVRIRKKL